MSAARSTLLCLIGALAAAIFLVGLALDLPNLRLASKTLPVLAMAAWVWPRADRRIAVGLIFGALGDFFLALPHAFVPGMAAFAAGHACYAWAFARWQREPSAMLALPIAIYLGILIGLLRPGLDELFWPVMAYMAVIGIMLWRAAGVAAGPGPTAPAVRQAALAGALLFVFSDTLIGISRFALPMPEAGYAIMLSYWAGQWLIARAGWLQGRAARPGAA